MRVPQFTLTPALRPLLAPPQLPALHHPVGKHPGLHCRTKAPMSRITRVRELCVPSRVTPPFPVGPRPGTSGGRKRALPPPRPLPAALIPPGSATGHAATGAGCRSVTIPRLLPALPPARVRRLVTCLVGSAHASFGHSQPTVSGTYTPSPGVSPLTMGLALEAQAESDAIFLARIDGEEGPLYFSSSGAQDVCAPRPWGAVVGQRAQALPDGSRGCKVPCP